MEAFSLRPWFVLFSQSMFYKQLCVYMETFALLPCSRCKECIVLPGMKELLIVHRRVAQQVNPNDKWQWTMYMNSSDEDYIILRFIWLKSIWVWNTRIQKPTFAQFFPKYLFHLQSAVNVTQWHIKNFLWKNE